MTGPELTDADRTAIPYLPFDTFKNFVELLSGGRPLPPRIDRSLMSGMAGGTQTLLLGALTTFGLIGSNREVQRSFVDLVQADDDHRRTLLGQLLQQVYPEPMELAAQHATADQLAESFRILSGYQGSTLRKAITFFLNMARYAQVEVSPFFRAPAQSTPARKPAGRRARTSASAPTATPGPPEQSSAVESRSIDLGSGGTVSISCSVSFLSLSRADRDFVFDLVDKLEDYRRANPTAPDGAPLPTVED